MRRLIAAALIALGTAIAGLSSAGAQIQIETCYSQSQWMENPQGCRPPGAVTAAGAGKTTSQCEAEYAANKAAIKASGQTKRAFVAACRLRQ
jgi:hypothetical protein